MRIAYRELTRDDFWGAHTHREYLALTQTGFEYKYTGWHVEGSMIRLDGLSVFAYFDRSRSTWDHKDVARLSAVQRSLLLEHEQGHFAIAELAGRKLAAELEAVELPSRYTREAVRERLTSTYQRRYDALLAQQARYDRETDHGGSNPEMQDLWTAQLEAELKR